MDKIGSDAAPELQRAIYLRGLFITRFSGAEVALSHLLVTARQHPSYSDIPTLPFSLGKIIALARRVAEMNGPISDYRARLEALLVNMEELQGLRDFMVHAIFGSHRENPGGVKFRMFRKRGSEIEYGSMDTDLAELEALANAAMPLSSGLCSLVTEICRQHDLRLPPIIVNP